MAPFDDDGLDELRENRFAHLLKPIRDLADNFNVDLAHELEEYLEQLEHTGFAFEGARGTGAVDFAEAALLIQGSTCVYSKKVEYLVNLVYQALEAVKGKRRAPAGGDALGGDGDGQGAAAGNAGPRGRAAARAEDDEDEGLERFWDVEPLLAESNDLDLAPGDGLLPNTSANARPPAALLALEDQGQGAASSTAAKGDGDSGVLRLQHCVVHCSGALLLDARDGDMYDQDLRYIGPQHPQAKWDLEQLAASQRLEPATQLMPLAPTQAHAPGAAPGEEQQQQPSEQQQQQTAEAQAQPGGAEPAGAPMDVDAGAGQPPPQDDYYDDGGGGGGGGADGDFDDVGAGAQDPQQPPTAAGEGGAGEPMATDGAEAGQAAGDASGAPPSAMQPRQTRQQAAAAAAAAAGANAPGAAAGDVSAGADQQEEQQPQEEEEFFNPYKPLDPASKSRLADRPLVVRKPRVKECRAQAAAARGDRVASAAAKAAGGLQLLLPEFAYCLRYLKPLHAGAKQAHVLDTGHPDQQQQKPASGRAAGARRGLDALNVAAPVFDAHDAAAAVAADDAANEEPPAQGGQQQPQHPGGGEGPLFGDDDAGDEGGGGADLGGGADDYDADEGGMPPGGGADGAWGLGGDGADLDGGAGGARELVLRGRGGAVPMGPLAGSGEGGMAVDGAEPSYEELCRAHMESLLSAAAAREVQTDLARRVSNWRQRIDPVLQAEESRPAFDIQDYGERILGRLSCLQVSDGTDAPAPPPPETSVRVGFRAVAHDLHKYEVSRMFSAMLQLINNRNVAIFKVSPCKDGAASEDAPFALQLLSTDMYHKSMGARLALEGPTEPGADGAEQEDEENRATQAAARAGKGGRGKGGGAKRAKKAALVDANADD